MWGKGMRLRTRVSGAGPGPELLSCQDASFVPGPLRHDSAAEGAGLLHDAGLDVLILPIRKCWEETYGPSVRVGLLSHLWPLRRPVGGAGDLEGGGQLSRGRRVAEQTPQASTTERRPVSEALLCAPSPRAKCVIWPQDASLQTTPASRCYLPYFVDEDTKAQRGEAVSPGPHSQGSSGPDRPRPVFLNSRSRR